MGGKRGKGVGEWEGREEGEERQSRAKQKKLYPFFRDFLTQKFIEKAHPRSIEKEAQVGIGFYIGFVLILYYPMIFSRGWEMFGFQALDLKISHLFHVGRFPSFSRGW